MFSSKNFSTCIYSMIHFELILVCGIRVESNFSLLYYIYGYPFIFMFGHLLHSPVSANYFFWRRVHLLEIHENWYLPRLSVVAPWREVKCYLWYQCQVWGKGLWPSLVHLYFPGLIDCTKRSQPWLPTTPSEPWRFWGSKGAHAEMWLGLERYSPSILHITVFIQKTSSP